LAFIRSLHFNCICSFRLVRIDSCHILDSNFWRCCFIVKRKRVSIKCVLYIWTIISFKCKASLLCIRECFIIKVIALEVCTARVAYNNFPCDFVIVVVNILACFWDLILLWLRINSFICFYSISVFIICGGFVFHLTWHNEIRVACRIWGRVAYGNIFFAESIAENKLSAWRVIASCTLRWNSEASVNSILKKLVLDPVKRLLCRIVHCDSPPNSVSSFACVLYGRHSERSKTVYFNRLTAYLNSGLITCICILTLYITLKACLTAYSVLLVFLLISLVKLNEKIFLSVYLVNSVLTWNSMSFIEVSILDIAPGSVWRYTALGQANIIVDREINIPIGHCALVKIKFHIEFDLFRLVFSWTDRIIGFYRDAIRILIRITSAVIGNISTCHGSTLSGTYCRHNKTCQHWHCHNYRQHHTEQATAFFPFIFF